MKVKFFVVVLAMLVAALSFTSPAPCVGGVYQGSYTVRTCENPTACSFWLTFTTFEQKCDIWCCPGNSTSVYNPSYCTNMRQNGCCRERTDLGPPFPNPQIIYDDPQKPRVACPASTE